MTRPSTDHLPETILIALIGLAVALWVILTPAEASKEPKRMYGIDGWFYVER